MSKRTTLQNRYLHAVFTQVKDGLRAVGYDEVKTMEDAKIVCKHLFKVEKTSKLNKKEMVAFIEEIQRWGATYLNINIPDPKQTDFL